MDRRRRIVLLGLAAVVAGALPGCGFQPPKTVPVLGKVVFKGGKPIPMASLQFIPVPGGSAPGYIANATTGQDGAFKVQTYLNETATALDGAAPGKYKVEILGYPGGPKLPQKYASLNDTLTVEVPDAGNPNLTLELDPS